MLALAAWAGPAFSAGDELENLTGKYRAHVAKGLGTAKKTLVADLQAFEERLKQRGLLGPTLAVREARLACSLESDDRSAIDFPLDLKAFGEDYPDQVGDLKKLEARHSERVDKVLLPSRRTLLNELAKLEKRLVKEGRVKDALAVRAQHERTEAVIRWPGTKKSIPEGALQWNGNYYHFYDKKMNWTEAKKFCEKLGGHLVVLTSPEENAQVAKLHGGTYCWIGATDEKSEGEFKWVTGEPFEYTRWHHRPDNLEGRQHYLIYHATSGWDDVVHDRSFRFICEWEKPEEF